MNRLPYHNCPSFDRCSCNRCPLDPDFESKLRYPDEEKCRAEKPTRYRIGSEYPELPYQGLSKREWTGKNMPQGERDRLRELFLQRGLKRQNGSKASINNGGGNPIYLFDHAAESKLDY